MKSDITTKFVSGDLLNVDTSSVNLVSEDQSRNRKVNRSLDPHSTIRQSGNMRLSELMDLKSPSDSRVNFSIKNQASDAFRSRTELN